jgi:hypothetical protein
MFVTCATVQGGERGVNEEKKASKIASMTKPKKREKDIFGSTERGP